MAQQLEVTETNLLFERATALYASSETFKSLVETIRGFIQGYGYQVDEFSGLSQEGYVNDPYLLIPDFGGTVQFSYGEIRLWLPGFDLFHVSDFDIEGQGRELQFLSTEAELSAWKNLAAELQSNIVEAELQNYTVTSDFYATNDICQGNGLVISCPEMNLADAIAV